MTQVARVWGKPWVLERSSFPDDILGLNKYMYCLQWGLLVDAVNRCEGIFLSDEEETEEELLQRVCAKGCGLRGARIRLSDGGAYEMRWREGTGSSWKVGAQLMLSRSGAAECQKHKLVIEKWSRTTIFFFE